MADQDHYKTYVRETRTTQSSGAGMALLVGGLVVAVGFILWFVFGGSGPVATGVSQGDTTSVTIEAPAVPVETAPTVSSEPAAEPAAPAPVPAED